MPADGAVLAATFGATSVLAGDSVTTLADVKAGGTTFLDTTPAGDVVGYATVRTTPPPPPPPPRPVASVEWVTITPSVVGSIKLPIVLELWFHPQAGPPDNAIVEQLAVQVFDDRTGTRLAIVAPVAGGGPNPVQDQGYGNLWHLTIRPPRQFTGYLRLVFDAAKTGLKTPIGDVSLQKWTTQEQIEFIGWDPARDRVIAYARVPGTQG